MYHFVILGEADLQVAVRDKFGTSNVAAKTLIPDVFLV